MYVIAKTIYTIEIAARLLKKIKLFFPNHNEMSTLEREFATFAHTLVNEFLPQDKPEMARRLAPYFVDLTLHDLFENHLITEIYCTNLGQDSFIMKFWDQTELTNALRKYMELQEKINEAKARSK